MPKYMRAFDTHEAYELWTASEQYVTPSIAGCVNENEVHYNPVVLKYVDLGLPSGTLWATENLKDANGNELYFAWGETVGYTADQVGTGKNFSWSDYKYGTSSSNLTKYNSTDGKTVLEPTDDAATVLWGDNWCMPTKEQFQELIDNTTAIWTQVDGINGMLLTSNYNGNTLFFSCNGHAADSTIDTSLSIYWCLSIEVNQSPNGASQMNIYKDENIEDMSTFWIDRYIGCSVRPVHISGSAPISEPAR